MSKRRPIVLCVTHDSGLMRQRRVLDRNGYEVLTVTGAREALSVLAELPVDATLLECEVPEMNAAPLVRRMKQIKPHIPVLLLMPASARTQSAKSSAADAVITKNESPVRLLIVLDHLLNVRFPFFTRWFGNWKHRASA